MEEKPIHREPEHPVASSPAPVTAPATETTPRRSRAWPIAFTLVLITALLVGGFLANRSFDVAGKVLGLPARAAAGLEELFGTEVEVTNSTISLGDQSIAELALMERDLVTTTKYETKFLAAKATAIIKGHYRVKTGFDLSEGYELTLDEAGEVVRARLPEAKVLSIQTISQEVFYLDDSVLKGIDSKEWEDAYKRNREAAEAQAAESGLLEETRNRFLERAADLLGARGLKVEAVEVLP